jgi:4-amino-4-deoxy-L-arabinose transferase-like glycosyltransferase
MHPFQPKHKLLSAPGISFVSLFIVLGGFFYSRLSYLPVRIWDEARNAANALEMYLHGHPFVSYYNGSPDMWNTKPPLLTWLQVCSLHIFGVNEWAIRFPSATASVATGLLIWVFIYRLLRKPWAAFMGGAIFTFNFAYLYNHAGRTGDFDALMILFTTGMCFCFFFYAVENASRWLVLFFVFLTLAALTKGIAAFMLLPGLAVFALAQKKIIPSLTSRVFWTGLVLTLFFVLGYYFLREKLNPGYLQAVYDNELGGRYLSALEGHEHNFDYYFMNMRQWRYTYWIWFLLPAFLAGDFSGNQTIRKITLFNFLLVMPYFLIISTGKTKLEWYDLPLYPFLSVQIALLLHLAWIKLKLLLPDGLASKLVPLVLFVVIFFSPIKTAQQVVFHYKEQTWDVDPHKPGYYLKYLLRSPDLPPAITVCYSGYHVQVDFYLIRLQLKGVDARLIENTEGLGPRQLVVVSQENMEQDLLQHYRVTRTDEKYGCRVYLVHSRL